MIGGIGGFTPQAGTSKPAAPWYSMREGLPSNSKKTEEAAETEEGEEGEEVAEEE